MNFIKTLIILIQFATTYAVSSFTIDEKFQTCNNGSLNYFDISTINITALNDTYTVFSGKLKVLKLISNNWTFSMIGERYDRGQWSLMLKKESKNFCDNILSPLE